jgi:hypothetical protein
MSRRASLVLAGLAILSIAVLAWRFWWPNDARDIRNRLNALAADFNESTTDGLGTVARAVRLATYFTDDVVVELGQGSPPIRGRETLVGMASRLQMRTAAFRLELLDINVDLRNRSDADVRLTAAFRRLGGGASGEGSIDAQEISLRMTKANGDWRISHVATVDPFR